MKTSGQASGPLLLLLAAGFFVWLLFPNLDLNLSVGKQRFERQQHAQAAVDLCLEAAACGLDFVEKGDSSEAVLAKMAEGREVTWGGHKGAQFKLPITVEDSVVVAQLLEVEGLSLRFRE